MAWTRFFLPLHTLGYTRRRKFGFTRKIDSDHNQFMGRKRSRKNPLTEKSAAAAIKPSLRIAISMVLILHLVVVIATPLGMVMPASRLARKILQYAAPYVQAGNISHGYAFFAPDPGPGHIIEYELVFEDGRTQRGKIPDLQRHWPRLRYHRHFMLTEQLAALHEDPPPRPEDPRFENEWKQMRVRWEAQNQDFERRANSYGKHLLKTTGASQVEMHVIRHHLPSPEEVLRGKSLQDRGLYETGRVITVTAGRQP
jgi:hypothetical protein